MDSLTRRLLRNGDPVLCSYRALVLGVGPIILLTVLFEILVPDNLLADSIRISDHDNPFDISRFVLFVCIGVVHVILCACVSILSISNVMSRLAKVQSSRILTFAFVAPTLVLILAFWASCYLEPKIYRISYGRVIHMIQQTGSFTGQFAICNRDSWLTVFCASGNLTLSLFCLALIVSGMFATVAVCMDMGVSTSHHNRMLTPRRLNIAGKEMHEDVNRYATSMLIVLTSSSVSISVFQLLGYNLLSPSSVDAALYERAALAASLFWPFSFSAAFLGIFTIPTWSIFRKRSEALRLLDVKEITDEQYEQFFAVRQAMPQSLKWMLMSGVPLIVSFAPRLISLSN